MSNTNFLYFNISENIFYINIILKKLNLHKIYNIFHLLLVFYKLNFSIIL